MAPAALRRPLAGVPAPRRRLGPGGRAPGAAGRGSAPVRPGSAPPDAGAAAVAAYEPHPGAGRARPRPPRGTRSLPVTERRQNWRKTPQEASFRRPFREPLRAGTCSVRPGLPSKTHLHQWCCSSPRRYGTPPNGPARASRRARNSSPHEKGEKKKKGKWKKRSLHRSARAPCVILPKQ
ncbi:translation initiation factor IF-2-like isoform X1 [Falco naumanni]|uniref:translation initiation factor IF-2-like isoform X1 n=1 Tax=Falco naumanni TaxID=148594 RepID=UPI001ADDF312|nr:translation initiation factor IF-2-like isoform X1 [Falco naumanni]